ncbi:hypothetical protein [Nostoc sphaeroides]|uniref:Uncharacterized protein n=2 Tax=Nostoc sphaeroides TaxID=446679 RepID=A0A5P8WEB2_9NOSO|nr:hypothetical protein [Nostoc sphaeroides]QFS50950.1 hypothetical protein GXM_08444 [Nostoc sphaeroides CCNUC1]
MINKLIFTLNSELELTGKEIADALWLAVHIQPSQLVEDNNTNQSNSTLNALEKADEPLLNQTRDNIKSESSQKQSSKQEPQGDIYNPEKDTSGSNSGNLTFKVPDARSLREPLTLTRAMRPLMRRVPSSTNTVLDEAATVKRIADEKNWIPVLKPAMEPWLDIALVVDESASMLIWQHTITEFKRLLEHYGIFRDVRTWGLKIDEGAMRFC